MRSLQTHPRDAEDALAWVEIDGDEVCPGCMTLRDEEQLRSDSPPGDPR